MHAGTIRLAKHLETLCRTIEPNRILPHDLVAAAVNADPDNPNQRIRDLNGIAAIVPTSRLRRVGNAFEGNASDVEYWSIDQAAIRLAIASDVNAIIEAGNAAQGDDEAEPTKPTGKPATVNERMAGTIMENPEAMGWNSAQWAKHLKCGKSSVVETATWKKLESARLQAKAERMKNRRRKPKASDSRRD